jgi:hypothetical protein
MFACKACDKRVDIVSFFESRSALIMSRNMLAGFFELAAL